MGDLDDILKKHNAKKEEEKMRLEETAANVKSEQMNVRAEFKKCVDEIILPILREYQTSLKNAGYFAVIEAPLMTESGEPGPDKQFYNRVTFKFDTDKFAKSKEVLSSNAHSIIFQSAAKPNVAVSFDNYTKRIEGSEFFIRETLMGIFKKMFPE
ncbi:MAG: hypothetical protein ACHQ0Y_06450 [Thermodesulfovibrionales bacterium]